MTCISRREFMASAASTAFLGGLAEGGVYRADFWKLGPGIRKPKPIKPGAKLRIACIGIGGRGNLVALEMTDEHIVALCDVDDKRAAFTKEKFTPLPDAFPKARRYKDYRNMLADMDHDIDAVIIATPDHTHFPAAMLAISMGKHVYCEKPLTNTIMSGSYANALSVLPYDYFINTFRKNRPKETYARSPGHFIEWINACKGGEPAGSNFDYAGPLAEVVLLGNLAVRTGKKILCDPVKREILNLPEDHPFIRPAFRTF